MSEARNERSASLVERTLTNLSLAWRDVAATAFGATPERLVSRRGHTIETEALAGSIGRGDTPSDDEALAEELAASSKDRLEHSLVVEALRDQLENLASSVTIGPRSVRRLASVQHLQTTIRASLSRDRHILSLVEALHPTPAVGGLPPATAREMIRRAESFSRGWYAAPVGWFDARGNGEFAVAIRSAVAANTRATLFAGAGVVADSAPENEWEELQLKYRPVLDALTK
jgi:menaquinone-specific isochorismate synthase